MYLRVLMPNHFLLQGSGSGINTLNVAQELVKMGHDVLVIVPEHQAAHEACYPFEIEVILFDNGQNSNDSEINFNFPCFTTHTRSVQTFYDLSDAQLNDYVNLWRTHTKSAMRSFDVDIIHAYLVWTIPYVASEIGIPTITSVHGTDLMGFRKGPRYRDMALIAAARAHSLITISHQVTTDTISTYNVAEEKVYLIWNGFDTAIFRVIPEVTKKKVKYYDRF